MATKLVKGTAVVSLADGLALGTIDHVYLDPERKEIVGFSFHKGGGIFGERTGGLVDASDVHAFGQDAVTIRGTAAVHSELAIDARCGGLVDLEDLLDRVVITEGGSVLGRVATIRFAQDTHRLEAIEVATGPDHERRLIPADAVAQIGAELVVVLDIAPMPATTASHPTPVPHDAPLRAVSGEHKERRLARAG